MKQLLIERSITVYPQSVLEESSTNNKLGYLVESTNGVTRIKYPATILDTRNENGRVYSKVIMEGAIRNCAEQFKNKELLCSVDGHPEGPYVEPGNASHVVTAAWVENNTFWNEAEILNTTKGRDLKALIEAKVAIGFSIRGLGSVDNYGNLLEDYEYLGTDCVGQPSAKIRAVPEIVDPLSKSTKVESFDTKRDNMQKFTSPALKSYIQEQVILAKNESKSNALSRIAKIENTLSEQSHIPAHELAEIYSTWNSAKNELFAEAKSKSGKSLAELEEQVASLENHLNIQSKANAKSQAILKKKYESSVKKLASQLRKEAKTRFKLIESKRKLEESLNAVKKVSIHNRKMAASRIAESELKVNIALQEAIKAVNSLTKSQMKESVRAIRYIKEEFYNKREDNVGLLVSKRGQYDDKVTIVMKKDQNEIVVKHEQANGQFDKKGFTDLNDAILYAEHEWLVSFDSKDKEEAFKFWGSKEEACDTDMKESVSKRVVKENTAQLKQRVKNAVKESNNKDHKIPGFI